MIIWLPLEKLDQRYTVQWAKWYPDEFLRLGIAYMTIEGDELTSSIEVGQVLDAYGTNYWKFTQLANLIKEMRLGKVNSDDTLLFADIWFPGLEALEYISCLGGIRPKITGVLHAGTYDSSDFTYIHGMRPWGRPLEECWFSFVDRMFVGSKYHKKMVLDNFRIPEEKIVVTTLPFYPDKSNRNFAKDDNLIVFPHRLDPEKKPWEFDAMKEIFPQARFIKTKEHNFTKKEYFDVLSKSSIVVSFAQHENFGYGMFEATSFDCIPFMPNGLSYAEYYPSDFLYSTTSELYQKIGLALNDTNYREAMRKLVRETAHKHEVLFSKSIENMTREMK